MKKLVEMWDEIGFPQFFVINLNRKRVLYCPFPPHVGKIEDKTNSIHDIGTHLKGRDNPSGDNSIELVFSNGHG